MLSELPGAPAVAGAADRPITLRFAGDRTFGGSDGCNQLSGSYVLDCLSIRMTDIASTMMACDEPVMTRAAGYAKALGLARGYDVADGQLTLLDENGMLLARFVMQTEALAGTAWTVTAYNNGKLAVVSVIAGTEITASFENDGQVTGRAGCNRYFATYRTEDGSLAIGAPGATRMHCGEPAGLMEQEQQYLAALQSAAAFEVNGDVLTLRTAGGETAVTMSKRPQ